MGTTLLLGVALLVGCTEAPPRPEAAPGASAPAADPDLCAEHGVLEAVCTRCNPALIPVFQAKGDWCAAHGLPESFCPVCSPEAGGRPVVDVSADGAPADGTVVRLRTRAAADQAGIATEPAVEADWATGTPAVARLVWDATRVALVSARSGGVVSSIAADVGTPVEPGTALAHVRSAHVAGDRSRVAAARQAVAVAEAEVARKRDLLASGVSSERAVLQAEQALASARAEAAAFSAELGLVGGGAGDGFVVTAPIAGVVTARHAAVGQVVDPVAPLFEVVDPSRLWAEVDVAESDLATVRTGQAVRVVLDALPDHPVQGTLAWLAPALDPATRTARGRVELANPDGLLRANMVGTASVSTDATRAVVTVPSAAVQSAGDAHLVFVREAVDRFVARRVRVVARAGDRVRVEGPVQPGDPVVTTGAFLLKTETLKDSIGAGCCDVE